MKNIIIYGDIHGCYDSFMELRKKINPKEKDIEICVGDVITKGKNSIKVLDFLIDNSISSVLGNHEDKIIRWLEHSKKEKKNPIILNKDEQDIVNNLTKKHISYLKNMPLYLKLKDILVLHGGVLNHFDLNNLSKKEKQQILRLRYINRDGNFLANNKEDKNSKFWAKKYDGRFGFIVYGHQWSSQIKEDKFSYGIDTGCVYGNKLTAIKIKNMKKNKYTIYQVKSTC